MASAQKTDSLSWRWKEIDLCTNAEVDTSDHVVLGAGGTSTFREREREWRRGEKEGRGVGERRPRFCRLPAQLSFYVGFYVISLVNLNELPGFAYSNLE